MAVGVVTTHAPAHLPAPLASPDEAANLLEEVQHFTQQIVTMAETEAAKPAAAVNLSRLRQIAEEVSEVYDLLRIS